MSNARELLKSVCDVLANARLANIEDIEVLNAIYIELSKPEPEPDAYLTVDSTGRFHVHLGKMSDSTMKDWNIKYQYKLNIAPPTRKSLSDDEIADKLG
jgi:hypothetical protein